MRILMLYRALPKAMRSASFRGIGSRRVHGGTGSRASPRHTPTCSRCLDGRPASSGSRFIRGSLIEPIGSNPQKTHMPEPMNDSDETIRRVLEHVGRDLDPSILIGGWATHLRVGGEISHDIDLIVTPSSRYLLDAVVENLTDNSVHQTRKF